MMKAPSKILMFVSSFLAFAVTILIAISYSYSTGNKEWYVALVRGRIFHIPFLAYLLLFSLMIGMAVTLTVYLVNRRQYGNIEENLRNLASGKYENLLAVGSEDEQLNTSIVLVDIDTHIHAIRNKLLDLSKEIQIISNQPQLVDGQTKEEILTGERQRLARELHDSVSQQLFGAMMLLSALNEQAGELTPVFQKQLQMVESIINESQSEMRALLLHLRPIQLEGKRLRKGVEQLLVELKTKIQIEMKWDIDDVCLPNGIEDHLFRIVQELLSNALRHSKATELDVYLKEINKSVLLRIVDDGVGFDVSENRAGSYGLQNIKERVLGMGGTCKIISFPGKGTSIEIRIPLLGEVSEEDD
ncbi:sensor histidine kinase [Isobaculum melis]|uniref:Sensor histidine kinase n=1 Tax=Isobaculum melis TaxID=142588 RepID=A0A1H9S4P2_9LACT|nr:sensor histidine kinase [Isobaculum melis]SER80012.1 two-component system, NarL family, sensor histidine kinase LiaS [Isobaculum melis]